MSTKFTPEEKRMKAVMASFKKYVNTYSKGSYYHGQSDKTFILDMFYGIGIALDPEKYKMAGGFRVFQTLLKSHLEGDSNGLR